MRLERTEEGSVVLVWIVGRAIYVALTSKPVDFTLALLTIVEKRRWFGRWLRVRRSRPNDVIATTVRVLPDGTLEAETRLPPGTSLELEVGGQRIRLIAERL